MIFLTTMTTDREREAIVADLRYYARARKLIPDAGLERAANIIESLMRENEALRAQNEHWKEKAEALRRMVKAEQEWTKLP